MENIAGYVFDHTSEDEGRWHRFAAEERGPHFVSALYGPQKAEFLRLVRLHREKSPGFDPLDGGEHRLGEVARWIGIKSLAARFVGLAIILGVFELADTREGRAAGDRQDKCRSPERVDDLRFRFKGSRPRAAIEGSGDRSGPRGCGRRPGPRRPRLTRCARARTCGINRAGVM